MFLLMSLHDADAPGAPKNHPRPEAVSAPVGASLAEGLLDAAPDAMIVVDAAGIIVRANVQAVTLFGYEREELIGQAVEVLVPSHLRAGHPAQRAAYTANPPVRQFSVVDELAAVHRDGHEFPVEISLNPLPTEAGMFIVASVRDISERQQAEASLRLAEEQFRGAFDQAPIGMALVSISDGRFLKVNQALCELVGYSEVALLDLADAGITHSHDIGRDLHCLDQMLSGELRSYQLEKRYIHASGDCIWVNLSASLVRDGAGRPLHLITQIQNVSEQRSLEAQLRHLADHDPLTGLLNRRGLEEELERLIQRLHRQGGSAALVIVDIDHFKSVNDTLGHSAGDELINAVANLLKARLRASDIIARLGGDEFAVVLTGCEAEAATQVADAIVTEIRGRSLRLGGHVNQRVTASVGVTLLTPSLARVEDALVAADLAVYDAKEAGRDRSAVNLGEPEDTNGTGTGSRLAWIQRIRTAIEEERFTLHLQPILDLRRGEAHQHEVLLRMLDEQGQIVPPGAFLPVAERYGLICEIDRWVVQSAIRLIADCEAGTPPLTLEINLSGKSLGDPLMLNLIERELNATGIDPGRLIFEVTETAAVANMHLAREFAGRLSALGCRFALDDFGAGFGSFYYLKHLPCDYLKIDGEFVTQCIANTTDQHVIKALVGIARGLGKFTIAECVEDEGTLDFLRLNGVDFAQGYHIGRPAPLATTKSSTLPA